MSIQLCSVEDVRAFVGKIDNTDDILIGNMISYVSQEIESFLNRGLKKEFRTKYFNSDAKTFTLPSYPVQADTVTVTISDIPVTLNSDFYVWEDEGIIEFSFVVADYGLPKVIKVEYYGGLAVEDEAGILQVPDDIKFACVMQTAFAYKRRKDIGLSSINLPDGSINVLSPADLLPEVKKILSKYKSYLFMGNK